MIPTTARATILIKRPGFKKDEDNQGSVRYDSWETPGLIKKVEVDLVMDETSRSRISFFDPNYRIADAFSGYTDTVVVAIYFGHDNDLGKPIFEGILAEIDRNLEDTTFTVYDLAFVMKLWKRTGYANKKDDLAIVQKLVTRNRTPEGRKLNFSRPLNPKKLEPHDTMTQDAQTDWEHMTERLRECGLHYYVRGDTVYAQYPVKQEAYKRPLGTYTPLSEGLLSGWEFSFHALTGKEGRPDLVADRRRGKTGKRVEGKAGPVSTTPVVAGEQEKDPLYSRLNIKQDMPKPSTSKLNARALAKRELEREHAFTGGFEEVLSVGFVRWDVLEVLEFAEIGQLHSGTYAIEAVRYRYKAGDLSRRIELHRDSKENVSTDNI